jgi:hypothetical protein
MSADSIHCDPSLQNFNNFLKYWAGVYLHSDKAYVGLSIPNFIESNRYNDSKFWKNKLLFDSRLLDFNNAIKFKPALLTKMVKGAPLQVDLSETLCLMINSSLSCL